MKEPLTKNKSAPDPVRSFFTVSERRKLCRGELAAEARCDVVSAHVAGTGEGNNLNFHFLFLIGLNDLSGSRAAPPWTNLAAATELYCITPHLKCSGTRITCVSRPGPTKGQSPTSCETLLGGP